MRTIKVLIIGIVVAYAVFAAETVDYRGVLLEKTDTTVTLTFNVYSSEDGVEPVITETRSVEVKGGEYKIALSTDLVDPDGDYFVEVLDGDEVVIPREPLERPAEPMDDPSALEIGNTGGIVYIPSNVGIGTDDPECKIRC